jgi:hypothetical protein
MNPYSTPNNAASGPEELCDHLRAHDRDGYFYRGQPRDFLGPLVPSAYRRRQTTRGKLYTPASAEYRHSLRGVGLAFVEAPPLTSFSAIARAFLGEEHAADSHAMGLLQGLLSDDLFSHLVADVGFEKAIETLPDVGQLRPYRDSWQAWGDFVDHQHRVFLRLNGCNEFLGYALGQTISQHYVENSEFLDVSRSPAIAISFAVAPRLGPSGDRIPSPAAAEPGVVYRFDSSSYRVGSDLGFDYYSAPPVIDAVAILMSLVDQTRSKPWRPAEFVSMYALSGQRFFNLLALPLWTVLSTRIFLQQAAFLVPDELRVEKRDARGEQIIGFRAVEDLSSRRGVEKYYLKRCGPGYWNEALTELAGMTFPTIGSGEAMLIDLVQTIARWRATVTRARLGNTTFAPRPLDLWIPPRPDLVR